EHQRDTALGRLGRRRSDDIVDGGAVRFLILEPPEIENANPIGVEGLGELEGVLEELILILVGEVRAELVALRAERRPRRLWPVDLEDRRRQTGDAELETFEDALDVANL